MASHKKADVPDEPDVDINPIYVQEAGHEVPKHMRPCRGMLSATAPQVVRDELILDGNPRLNLATFVTGLSHHSRALAAHPRAHTPLAPEPFRPGLAH